MLSHMDAYWTRTKQRDSLMARVFSGKKGIVQKIWAWSFELFWFGKMQTDFLFSNPIEQIPREYLRQKWSRTNNLPGFTNQFHKNLSGRTNSCLWNAMIQIYAGVFMLEKSPLS